MSDTYSYSKLDTYVQCPFKYYLKYILGNYVYSESIATAIGTLIHETEENIAKAILANTAIDYIKLKNNIIMKLYLLQAKYPKDFWNLDKSDRNYYDKIYNYLETGIYKLEQFMHDHPTYKIVGIEQAFNIEYNGEHFKGFIDRAFYDAATDKYIIQDIKTYAVPVETGKLATPLQFVIYTLAAKELYNCTSDQVSCQYYLPFCDLTQPAGTSGYMTRGINKLEQLFKNIHSELFTPNATPLCNWCEFCAQNPDTNGTEKFLCPYYSLWHRDTRNKYEIKQVKNKWQGLENHATILENYLQNISQQ